MLLKDARGFATVRWIQQGFRRAHGTERPGTTMRNLFGQVDGTSNPQPGTDDFERVVWSDDGWLAGGTGMVLRRIRMDLDTWDRLDRGGREASVGRTLRGRAAHGDVGVRRAGLRRDDGHRVPRHPGVRAHPARSRRRDGAHLPTGV